MKAFSYILARLGEASTYSGLGLVLGGMGVTLSPGVYRDVMLGGMIVAGAAAVIIKEGWRKALADGDLASAVTDAAATAAQAK